MFTVGDLADSESAFDTAIRMGQARLRASDGTNLAVLPETELAALTKVVRSATLHVRVGRLLGMPAASRSSADFGEDVWLEVLDDEDLATFLDELGAVLLVASREQSIDQLDQLLADWRVTAEALADPEDREILLGGYSDADFVEVHRPE